MGIKMANLGHYMRKAKTAKKNKTVFVCKCCTPFSCRVVVDHIGKKVATPALCLYAEKQQQYIKWNRQVKNGKRKA